MAGVGRLRADGSGTVRCVLHGAHADLGRLPFPMPEANWCCGSAVQANKNKDRFEQKFAEVVDLKFANELEATRQRPSLGAKKEERPN